MKLSSRISGKLMATPHKARLRFDARLTCPFSFICLLLCCPLVCTACGDNSEESIVVSSASSQAADSATDASSDSDFSMDSRVQTISEQSVKEISAGCTYEEIYSQLGNTANYGRPELHVWRLDTGEFFFLQADSDAICEADGTELLEKSKVALQSSDDLEENQWMGILTDDNFAISPDDLRMDCVSLSLENTTLEWEDGTAAALSDCTEGTIIQITFTDVAESYPPQISPITAILSAGEK